MSLVLVCGAFLNIPGSSFGLSKDPAVLFSVFEKGIDCAGEALIILQRIHNFTLGQSW